MPVCTALWKVCALVAVNKIIFLLNYLFGFRRNEICQKVRKKGFCCLNPNFYCSKKLISKCLAISHDALVLLEQGRRKSASTSNCPWWDSVTRKAVETEVVFGDTFYATWGRRGSQYDLFPDLKKETEFIRAASFFKKYANNYYGYESRLHHVVLRQTLRTSGDIQANEKKTEMNNSSYHIDVEDDSVFKVIVNISDVHEGASEYIPYTHCYSFKWLSYFSIYKYFAYLKGWCSNFFQNSFNQKSCSFSGPAGQISFFDAGGIHRGGFSCNERCILIFCYINTMSRTVSNVGKLILPHNVSCDIETAYKGNPIAFGTGRLQGNQAVAQIANAIRSGYSYIDTGRGYLNEEVVGLALQLSHVKREKIKIICKVPYFNSLDVESHVQFSLRDLQVEYIDAYLVHWPVFYEYGKNEHKHAEVRKLVWERLETFHGSIIHELGVSNYTLTMLKELHKYCHVKPSLLEIEYNPKCYDSKAVAFARHHGMKIFGYSIFGRGVLSSPIVQDIAARRGVSTSYIIRSWVIMHDVIPICTSGDGITRILDNLTFGRLTQSEMKDLNDMQELSTEDNVKALLNTLQTK